MRLKRAARASCFLLTVFVTWLLLTYIFYLRPGAQRYMKIIHDNFIFPPARSPLFPTRSHTPCAQNETIRFQDFKLNFRILYFPESLTTNCESGNLAFLAIVHSPPESVEIRQVIRETWADAKTVRALESGIARVVFLVGNGRMEDKRLQDEVEANQDIILIDVEDTYNNLVYKTAISLFISHNFCPTPFLLKVDQDVVFNIDRFVTQIGTTFQDKNTAIYCMVCHNWEPFRNNSSQWFVSRRQFPGNTYPDFCSGPSYALTSFAVSKLLYALPSVNLIKVEDVLITGIIAEKIGVMRINSTSFVSDYRVWRVKSSDCPGEVLSIHHQKTKKKIRDIWNFLSKNC